MTIHDLNLRVDVMSKVEDEANKRSNVNNLSSTKIETMYY